MASSRTKHRASELQSWPYCVFTIKSVHSASLFVYQLAMVGIKAQTLQGSKESAIKYFHVGSFQ